MGGDFRSIREIEKYFIALKGSVDSPFHGAFTDHDQFGLNSLNGNLAKSETLDSWENLSQIIQKFIERIRSIQLHKR